MTMVRHLVKIKHVYQDPHNPDIQTVEMDCDYATAYAFFKALIDSMEDFSIETAKCTTGSSTFVMKS